MGGTKITLIGGGFTGSVEDVTVDFDLMSCQVLLVSYTEVVCQTVCSLPHPGCQMEASSPHVLVATGNGVVSAGCEAPGCAYATSSEMTSVVEAIMPDSVDQGNEYMFQKLHFLLF